MADLNYLGLLFNVMWELLDLCIAHRDPIGKSLAKFGSTACVLTRFMHL